MGSAGMVIRYGMRPKESAAGNCIGTLVRTLPDCRNSTSTEGLAGLAGSGYNVKKTRRAELGAFFTTLSMVGVTLAPWNWNGSAGSRPFAFGVKERTGSSEEMLTPGALDGTVNSERCTPI